mmetsp:Transcript_31679/g.97951  ORF Transcript_31679/g.97951 Transcript_31679/m.97951 type:complete len:217 (-) Transcript_31679:18-668(-)
MPVPPLPEKKLKRRMPHTMRHISSSCRILSASFCPMNESMRLRGKTVSSAAIVSRCTTSSLSSAVFDSCMMYSVMSPKTSFGSRFDHTSSIRRCVFALCCTRSVRSLFTCSCCAVVTLACSLYVSSTALSLSVRVRTAWFTSCSTCSGVTSTLFCASFFAVSSCALMKNWARAAETMKPWRLHCPTVSCTMVGRMFIAMDGVAGIGERSVCACRHQ